MTRARVAYTLKVGRSGSAPSLLAGPDRVDHVELVEVDSGEVVLFWDAAPRDASRLARDLRRDLDRLDAEEFMRRWQARQD